MFPWSKLKNTDKIKILERAAGIMKKETNGGYVSGTNPSLRMAIVRAMTELKYSNMGVGGKREMSVTSEIGTAILMENPQPRVIAVWASENSLQIVLGAIESTVQMLERHMTASPVLGH